MDNLFQRLEDRLNSLSRAIDFFNAAMSQPDQCGTQKDAIEWLHESAESLRNVYWEYKFSKVKHSA